MKIKNVIIAIFAMCLSSPICIYARKANDSITVISREAGSGTRSAFIELFGVEQKDSQGRKIDRTVDTADITNSTEVVLSQVSKNANSIGYVSLGSLNSSVKALKIDKAEAKASNIKSGIYKICRPFNVIVKDDLSPAAQEFLRFILSSEGQAIVENAGYLPVINNPQYVPNVTSGRVRVAGSSSVFPVMEKLQEAFNKVNGKITIEVSQSDSTTGIVSAQKDICDIGMASRELKSNETGVKSIIIATDGIAVIVNKANPIGELSKEQVRQIFTGEIVKWSSIKQ